MNDQLTARSKLKDKPAICTQPTNAKKIYKGGYLYFPDVGCDLLLEGESINERKFFQIDISRSGQIKLKCKYQERYQKNIILVRLDLKGGKHTNPDGTQIYCPHLHLYREGYMDKWAFAISKDQFPNIEDLLSTLYDFFRFCN